MTAEQLIKVEEAFDETCRGESGDDSNTQAACAKRDALVAMLRDSGKCYGPIDAPMYQRAWGPCGTGESSSAAHETSEAEEPSEIHYDAAVAAKKQRTAYAEIQAYACMKDRVRFELSVGQTNRSRVIRTAEIGCAAYMQQLGLEGQELHNRLTEMASQVVRSVENEGNG